MDFVTGPLWGALLQAGADVLAVDNDGRTPQDLARESRHGRLVDLLADVKPFPARAPLASQPHLLSPPAHTPQRAKVIPRRPLLLSPAQSPAPLKIQSPKLGKENIAAVARPVARSLDLHLERGLVPSIGLAQRAWDAGPLGGAESRLTPPRVRRPALVSRPEQVETAESRAVAEKQLSGARGGLRAALNLEQESLRLEMSITKMQKVQLESLRRQVQVCVKAGTDVKCMNYSLTGGCKQLRSTASWLGHSPLSSVGI